MTQSTGRRLILDVITDCGLHGMTRAECIAIFANGERPLGLIVQRWDELVEQGDIKPAGMRNPDDKIYTAAACQSSTAPSVGVVSKTLDAQLG